MIPLLVTLNKPRDSKELSTRFHEKRKRLFIKTQRTRQWHQQLPHPGFTSPGAKTKQDPHSLDYGWHTRTHIHMHTCGWTLVGEHIHTYRWVWPTHMWVDVAGTHTHTHTGGRTVAGKGGGVNGWSLMRTISPHPPCHGFCLGNWEA